jgi:hypothetical protein
VRPDSCLARPHPPDSVPRSPCRRRLARAARPRSWPHPRRPPPDRLTRAAVAPTTRLARAAVPTTAVRSRRRLVRRRLAPLTARPSPSRRAAVSAPVSRRFPAIYRAPVPCRRRLAEQHAVGQCRRRALVPCVARCASRPSWAASVVHAGHAPRGHGPRRALCIWAERGFGPVAPG